MPKYIKKLLETGAPADFILIGATTRSVYDKPCLEIRMAEVYFEPLTCAHIVQIVKRRQQDEDTPRFRSA